MVLPWIRISLAEAAYSKGCIGDWEDSHRDDLSDFHEKTVKMGNSGRLANDL